MYFVVYYIRKKHTCIIVCINSLLANVCNINCINKKKHYSDGTYSLLNDNYTLNVFIYVPREVLVYY